LNHELDEYARYERTTASEVIRLAVSEYLHHHKPDLANAEA
jgi:metal-responsive CopG/Arc/MetJ family transcriptional regulator